MRMKFLKLQMILQLMGNHISCVHVRRAAEPETIKLIKWDGIVKIFDQPIHVSDVLREYPKHLVCRSDSFFIGQKIPPLSHSDLLQLGHKYFLLPLHCFQTVLSFVTIASLVNTDSSLNPLLKKAATCKAFDIQKSPSGCLRIRVSDEFITRLMEDNLDPNSAKKNCRVCTTPELQKDYRLLVPNSGNWKPKLETIREKEKTKISSFGIKKRRKSHPKVQPPPANSSRPSSKAKSKAKIKIKLKK